MSSKFFYDRQDGVCKPFMYGGCGGNDNRFDSKQECERQCFEAQGNIIHNTVAGKNSLITNIFLNKVVSI